MCLFAVFTVCWWRSVTVKGQIYYGSVLIGYGLTQCLVGVQHTAREQYNVQTLFATVDDQSLNTNPPGTFHPEGITQNINISASN